MSPLNSLLYTTSGATEIVMNGKHVRQRCMDGIYTNKYLSGFNGMCPTLRYPIFALYQEATALFKLAVGV